jgi:elongation factor Ts
MKVTRVKVVPISSGTAAAKYVHSDGKTASLVVVKADPASAAADAGVKEFAFDCCLHLAAFTPAYTERSQVDAAYLKEQEAIFTAQAASLDKPDNVKQGIVKGKLNKHLADICFVDQLFVKDDKVSVAKKLEETGKKAGAKLSFETALYWRLGA